MSRVEEALLVAEHLGPVFACWPGEKRPKVKWLEKASRSKVDVSRIFRNGSLNNLAMPTGPISGVWVLDEDPKHDGAQTLADLIARYGPIPETLMCRTPSGGHHIYFKWPAEGGIRNRGGFANGLDVRGENGYVLVPPSVLPNGAYAWVNWGQEIAYGPQWMLSLIREHATPKPPSQAFRPRRSHLGRTTPYGERALTDECSVLAATLPGRQEETLRDKIILVGSLVAGGEIEEAHGRAQLLNAAMSMVNGEAHNPWRHQDIDARITRGFAKGAESPRSAPPLERRFKTHQGAAEPEPHQGNGAAQPKPKPKLVHDRDAWRADLQRGPKGGLIKGSGLNHSLIIEHAEEFENLFVYNAEDGRLTITRPWSNDPRTDYPRLVSDTDVTALAARLETYGLSGSTTLTLAALSEVSERAWAVHPLRDMLTGLSWDMVERAPQFFTTYFGAKDTPYARAIGQRFLTGLVARPLRPGCKHDTMVYAEAPQGAGKSSAFRALVGEAYFTDQLGDITNKDAQQTLRGKWLVEVAEERHSKATENAWKAFLSQQNDRFRPSYGRLVVELPRRCVFAGTTNESTYLRDETGARRFWPIRCGKIDIAKLERDRLQLLAEAVARLELGEQWHLTEAEEALAQDEQEERFEVDPWEGLIALKLKTAYGFMATHEILNEWIGIDKSRQDMRHIKRLSAIMSRLKIIRTRDRPDGGPQVRGYKFS